MVWQITLIRKYWWPLTIGLALAAVAYLRVAGADSEERMSWMRLQAREQKAAGGSSQVRYLCAGGFAFDLGEGDDRIIPGEDRIFIVDAEAKKRCLLPWMPTINHAKMLLSATAPSSGYGATLIEIDSTQIDAVEKVLGDLEKAGWRESGASRAAKEKNPSMRGTVYERNGAWLLIVGVDQPAQSRNRVFLAGRFDLEVMRR
ncbi:MAG: hypothetical protein GY847_16025 [Proteobacteria bacterium]|nr:hypothetical protein [Pseudomonadota bacterium]